MPGKFADGDQSPTVLLLKFPIIESRGCGLVVARRLYFAAHPVQPNLAIEFERIGGILALVHLRQKGGMARCDGGNRAANPPYSKNQ